MDVALMAAATESKANGRVVGDIPCLPDEGRVPTEWSRPAPILGGHLLLSFRRVRCTVLRLRRTHNIGCLVEARPGDGYPHRVEPLSLSP
jgi:hypothetical protein